MFDVMSSGSQGGTKWPAVAAPLPGNFSEKALLAGNFSEKTILTGNFSEQTILAGSFIEPGNFGNFGLTIQEIFEYCTNKACDLLRFLPDLSAYLMCICICKLI
jgi:hypothetical protein